jgi:hypothetical protein
MPRPADSDLDQTCVRSRIDELHRDESGVAVGGLWKKPGLTPGSAPAAPKLSWRQRCGCANRHYFAASAYCTAALSSASEADTFM